VVRSAAKKLDLKMKCLIVFSFLGLAFVITDGIQTKRENHKILFALSVQKKINIDTIKVRSEQNTLVLEGMGSEPQIRYAEKVARGFMEKYGNRISSPPTTVRNEIHDKYEKKKGNRQVASVKTKRSR